MSGNPNSARNRGRQRRVLAFSMTPERCERRERTLQEAQRLAAALKATGRPVRVQGPSDRRTSSLSQSQALICP